MAYQWLREDPWTVSDRLTFTEIATMYRSWFAMTPGLGYVDKKPVFGT